MNNNKNIIEFKNFYLERLFKLIEDIPDQNFINFFRVIENARKKKQNIFIIANGGSAANAMTMENDLYFDLYKKIKKKINFISLVHNPSVITAIGNDISFEDIFLSQLKLRFKKNDVLLALSVSGNSLNITKSVKWVKKKKIGKVIGILGFDGGKVLKYCDAALHLNSEKGEYGVSEDFQLIVNHMIAEWYQKYSNNNSN